MALTPFFFFPLESTLEQYNKAYTGKIKYSLLSCPFLIKKKNAD